MRRFTTTLSVYLLCLIKNCLFAQSYPFVLDSKFNFGVEISSIVTTSNGLMLIAEKCKKIFFLDELGVLSKEISLDRGILANRDVEIEGTSLGNNCLFFSDEKNAKIYSLNFSDSSISEVKTNYNLSADVGGYGMEGIAVDESNNICYIMKEKNGNNQSVIHVFKIVKRRNKLRLAFIKNVFIEHPDNSWRYSDLFYNSVDQFLYCLKTKPGTYQVDTISTAQMKVAGDVIIKLNSLTPFKDISLDVNNFDSLGYNTNMEGLAISNKTLYLVSDNAKNAVANCDGVGQGKTLFIYYKL